MTDDELPTEEELDIYQSEPAHTLAPDKLKTDFKAWHHPRKQYVRIEQWCAEVRKLIPALGLSLGDPFKYLTLPGNELLDVRALNGVCDRAGVKLRYLGFNSVGAQTPEAVELALSQSEVRSLSSIDEHSKVLDYRLEAIANRRSPAHEVTMRAGPFHAINLDLCESIAFREIGHRKGSSLEAAGKLLELQLQSAKPWLLFITTKAQPDLIADFARDGFMHALDANSRASEAFKAKLIEMLASKIEELDTDIRSAWTRQDVRFLKLFSAGLGKWMLGILARASPPRGISLLSGCYYQSGTSGPNMLSLAFRCDGAVQVLQDPTAILPAPEEAARATEVEAALALADTAIAMFDLDAHVRQSEVLEKLVDKSGRLLASARFGEDAYRSWAYSLYQS
ncbi:hypothetical protein GCM10007276_32700 [Agaricicola taiwanensis]|uniref:Uncharacterized protein n=1 Tax=Agaricicola taiwanensis TaxID=591372 RepID=A0A8J2YMI6_9RHOB|nr:hypothetical protein [Agaricicola taiwanensis]GGE53118.1 hypothetical protein GCM10007276_32700 [Agaricicola taiwanensis]